MHLNTETALDFIDGRLQGKEAGFWNSHLSSCTACTQEVAEWQELSAGLKRSHLESAPEQDLQQAQDIFQVPELVEESVFRSLVASVVFDSFQQQAFAGARGAAMQARQLVLRAEEFDIHVKVSGEEDHRRLMGQVLPRTGHEFTPAARFHLLQGGERLESTVADEMGLFQFTDIPEGELSLQIDLPNLTVIGALSTKGLR